MYVKRPFGEKLNASFDFIKENWKQLFKYSTYLILPICLIQAANFSGLMGSMTDLTAMQASGGISDNPLAALGPSFALNYAYREYQKVEYLNNCFQFSFIKSKEAYNFSPKGRFTYIAILGFCDSMFFSIW